MVKNPPAKAGNTGSIPGSGRSPGEGKGNQLQYSCLGNPMDREEPWATVHVDAELDTTANAAKGTFADAIGLAVFLCHSWSRTVGSLKDQCVETHESIELRRKGRVEPSERQRESEQHKEGLLASPNSTEVSIRILRLLLLLLFSQGLRSLPGTAGPALSPVRVRKEHGHPPS